MNFNKKLAWIMTVTIMSSTFASIPITKVNADTNGMVNVEKTNDTITIGNEYIKREFSLLGKKVKTSKLDNKRAEKVFVPEETSEEFVIGVLSEKSVNWNVVNYSSEENKSENGRASNAIDGDPSTIWHTKYNGGEDRYPHHLVVDLGEEKNIEGFSYLPRQNGSNGNIKDYEFYVSNDSNDFGQAIKVGTFAYNDSEKINVRFDSSVKGRYIKLVAINSVNGANFASCAELDILEVGKEEEKKEIKTSDLTLNEVIVEDSAEANGKKVKFDFAPFSFNGANWDIDMNIVMENGDHFMRKYLEVNVDDPHATIDYMDLEHLVLNNTVEQSWSRPNMEGAFISGYQMALGQPMYINGMFLGSELPVTDNRIINKDSKDIAQIKYFSGKEFETLEKTKEGNFITWQTVVGAARSTDQSVIQSDFFEYIKTISTRTDFRKQYNSWYDHMMNITAENIEGSFYEIEKGLSQFGVEPVDSYVVDDGWNDYTGDFWAFNSKFPNELYDSTELTEKFSSNFGLWLGPRGGYNYNSSFAQQMEAAGTGGYNTASGDVCVGHPKYIENITTLFLDYMKKFDINYWKIDGNLLSPCPNKEHGHITGGPNGMYMVTETWEAWVNIFTKMREARPDLFINLTCYTNPSPWFLQWVNSVWLQNSTDVGFHGGEVDGSMMDAMLTYRDGRYFDFYETRQLQFPAANVYNHDPIYGNTNVHGGKTVTMNSEQFEKYLYMMMTRGTAFWELYYSYNLMDDEKWMINSEVLKWGEDNFNILRNAKLIGETPTAGNIYGYSAWELDNGIISLRNPSSENKTFTLTLDRLIGVGEGATNLSKTTIYPYGVVEEDRTYNYGDSITVELAPHEVLIWQFGKSDNEAAEIVNIKAVDNNVVRVEFNERILGDKVNYSIEDNNVTSAKVLIDHRTVELELENSLEVDREYTLNISGVNDLAENITTKTTKFNFYNENKVVEIKGKEDLKDSDEVIEGIGVAANIKSLNLNGKSYEVKNNNSINGVSDFGVSMLVKTIDTNTTLLSQGGEYSLNINSEGKLEFTVKGVTVQSKSVINNNSWNNITALREKNGMLKIYINGLLEASVYDETKNKMEISKSQVTIGSNEFTGLVSNIVIRNTALAFDEVKLDAESIPTGEFNIKPYSTVTLAGILPELPSKVILEYQNGAKVEVDVNWEQLNIEDFDVVGEVTVQGSIEGIEEKAIATIKVLANIPNDEFNLESLNSIWSIEREIQDKWSLTENQGYLTIHGTAGYNDSNDRNDNDNIFLQEKYSDDYAIYTKLSNKPIAGYQSAGLLSYEDNNNYVRIARKNVGRNILSFTYEVNGNARHIEIDDPVQGEEVYLALEKVGNNYTSYYSADGEIWNVISQNNQSTVEVDLNNDHKVGLYATNGTGPQYTAKFDYFRYLPYSPSTTVSSVDSATLELNVGDKIPSFMNGTLNLVNGEVKNAIIELVDVDNNITNAAGEYSVTGKVIGTNLTVDIKIVVKKENILVESVTLDKKEVRLEVGAIDTLTATVLPENATNKNIIWSSSNENIATVIDGVVTGISPGEATIKVTTEDSGIVSVCKVRVNKPVIAVEGITLDKSEAVLNIGENNTLIATVLPENATNKSVIWSSNNEGVAMVSNGVVTALKEGTAVITATTVDAGLTATSTIVVQKEQSGALSFKVTANDNVKVEENLEIKVGVNNIASNMYAMEFNVDYDKAKFEFVEATSMDDSKYIVKAAEKDGKLKVLVATKGVEIENSKDVVNLVFKAKATGENITFNIIDGKLGDGEGNEHAVDNSTVTTTVIEGGVDPNPSSDKKALEIAISYVEEVVANGGLVGVVPAVVNEFNAALIEARIVYENSNATVSEVEKAFDRLMKAIHMLEFKQGDKAELQKLVNIIEALDKTLYTKETWTNLEKVLEEAKKVLADENAMADEVNKTFDKLMDAYKKLEKVVDKTELEKMVNKVEALDKNLYIPSTLKDLEKALKKAKEVLAKESATQEEVDKAFEDLVKAYAKIRLKPNKDMLNGLIEEIKSIDLSKYTTSSVSKLNKELSKAMNVLNSEEATQKDVDKAFNNLKKAKDDLVAKADNVNPTNQTNPSYPTKPGNAGKTPSGGKLPNTGGAMGALGLLGIGGALAVAGVTIIKKRK